MGRNEIGRRNIISNAIIGLGSSTQGNTTIRYSNVGKYCAIAWNVTIGAPNHDLKSLAIAHNDYIFPEENRLSMELFKSLECVIGNDVWIAAGAHILRGVHVGNGSIVAAGAVVTKDIPPYTIVGGIPAKIIGKRFSNEIIKRLENIKWWDFNQKQLDLCRECFNDNLDEDKIKLLENIRNERY